MAMTDAPGPTPAKRIERDARDERLARALRDNLQRRKEQARAQQRNRSAEMAAGEPAAAPRRDEKPPA
jgi:hypothetical protein